MTMYSDAVERLKSQWQAMLDSGKMPLFEIQSDDGEYHVFDLSFYQSGNNHWYFVANDGGCWTKRIGVDSCFDDVSHYLESLYDACQQEATK
jgi:hypothetical protein